MGSNLIRQTFWRFAMAVVLVWASITDAREQEKVFTSLPETGRYSKQDCPLSYVLRELFIPDGDEEWHVAFETDRTYIATPDNRYLKQGRSPIRVYSKKDNTVLGNLDFTLGQDQIHIPIYMTDEAKTMGGVGTESKFALMEYAFDHFNVRRVIAHIANDNAASIALQKKLGFKLVKENGKVGLDRRISDWAASREDFAAVREDFHQQFRSGKNPFERQSPVVTFLEQGYDSEKITRRVWMDRELEISKLARKPQMRPLVRLLDDDLDGAMAWLAKYDRELQGERLLIARKRDQKLVGVTDPLLQGKIERDYYKELSELDQDLTEALWIVQTERLDMDVVEVLKDVAAGKTPVTTRQLQKKAKVMLEQNTRKMIRTEIRPKATSGAH